MSGLAKKVNFSESFESFKEKNGENGTFEGILVNYNHKKLAHGYYKFEKGSMKKNEGKTLFMLYNHGSGNIPIGTMTGVESEKGFMVEAKFDLSKDDNNNYINKDAATLYSLMKNGAKFEMSVGGWVTKGESKEEKKDGKTNYSYSILEFDAYEGSVTPRGAVEGSKVGKVFSDLTYEEFKKKQEGGNNMDPKQLETMMKGMFAEFSTNMLAAQTDEEIKALPGKFKEMEDQFKTFGETFNQEVKESYEAKFAELNEVIKGLKSNFAADKVETTDAEAFFAMLTEVNKHGKGVEQVFSADTELQFATPATGNTPNAVKAQYVTTILKRLQKKNGVIARINFLPTSDNSMFIPREMVGLPECGIVGETATRAETDGITLDNVTVNMYQFYCMPVVSNRLLATNFVGYLNFLMSRVEYAWGTFISDMMFTGTGTNQPWGVLKFDKAAGGLQEIEMSKAAADKVLAKQIIEIYYSVRSEIAENATWDMTRKMWAKIASLTNTQEDFYITDLNTGNQRTLMTRPVNIIESDVLTDLAASSAGDFVMTFGDWSNGIIGLQNNNLNIKIEDMITTKGVTKYWMEKLLGWAIQLPENFIRVKAKA